MKEDPIIFASGLVRYYPEQHLIETGNYHIVVPEKQLLVLQPLVQHLGELVLTDQLIDIHNTGELSNAERYKQRLRVQSHIVGLRKNFDLLLDGLGDPDEGILLNDFGRGYLLCKYWAPGI